MRQLSQVYGSGFSRLLRALFGRRETAAVIIWGHWLVQSPLRTCHCSGFSPILPGTRLQEYGNPAGASGRGVGAGRQLSRWEWPGSTGRLGKVANSGMFLDVSPLGRALVDKGLYLPESWTSDKDRCECARIGNRSKTELALEMVGRAQERGPEGWMGRGGRRLRDVAVLPGGPGGLGDVVRAGRSVRLYGVAAGVSGIRVPEPAARRSAPWSSSSLELPEEACREITYSAPRGCDRPAGASPAKSTGPSTAGTGTAANPATTCPMLRRIPRWRPFMAYRNETEKSDSCPWLASPRGQLFCLSLQQAWGEKAGYFKAGVLGRAPCGHHPTSLPELNRPCDNAPWT